ncbi:MAG: LysR family transcriptional regulator, partial [Silicimonas sp.]|nr:LysR family transcriptional regulator [Silicimonas sp.]
LYATPEYLAENGTPEKIEDLSDHRLICQRVTSTQVSAGAQLVQELLAHDIPSLLTVNNYFGVLQAVLAGLGIGVLPDYVIQDFPTIQRVLPNVESNEIPVFLAFPEELRQSKRIAAFRDFVTEEIIAHRRKMREDAEAH